MDYISLKDLEVADGTSTHHDSDEELDQAMRESQTAYYGVSESKCEADDSEIELQADSHKSSLLPLDAKEFGSKLTEEQHYYIIKTTDIKRALLAGNVLVQLLVIVLGLYWVVPKKGTQKPVYAFAAAILNLVGAVYLGLQWYYVVATWRWGRRFILVGSVFFMLLYLSNIMLMVTTNGHLFPIFTMIAVILAEIAFFVMVENPRTKYIPRLPSWLFFSS